MTRSNLKLILDQSFVIFLCDNLMCISIRKKIEKIKENQEIEILEFVLFYCNFIQR